MKATVALLNKKSGSANLSSYDKQHCVLLGDITILFEGRIYSLTQHASGAKIIAEKLKQEDAAMACESFLKTVEGDFTFIIAESERLIAGRDSVGVQPLYFGENGTVAALASKKKALWKLGIDDVRSFPPGHVVSVSREGFRFKPVKTLAYTQPRSILMSEAADTVKKLLEGSILRRVSGMKEVAVAFSGGLDSSVVAFLASKCNVNVHLIHVSLENRPETEEAKKAAEALSLPLHTYLFKESDVENVIAKVVELIEEPDPVKASIGVPFYWTAEKTAKAGFRVLLAGQGADELFGGYQRYVNEYLLHGAEAARKVMFDDVVGIYESNIERDVKICGFHDVELRLPFAFYTLAEFAVALPMELKIERKHASLRKLVLRKTAENLGLPPSIREKPKKAVQYATGVNGVVKKLAKKNKATVAEYINKLFLNQMTEKTQI
jgi:asparagine synthase (glutamine-hydrolysing)